MQRCFRLVCCVIVLGLLSALWTASALAYESYETLHIVNCDEWVSLRTKPSSNAARIMQIPKGALVSFVAGAGDFIQVSYSGVMGYVGKNYLSVRGEADYVPMYVANCNEWISLREEPSKSSERLAKIPLEAEVLSIEREDRQDAMSEVIYNYQIGYVDSKYLCLLPPQTKVCAIVSASMHIPDASGNDYVQTVTAAKRLAALESLLRAAKPDVSGNCPYHAQIVIELKNGRTLKLMYPTDGCTDFFTTDHSVYEFPTSAGDVVWKIFDQAAKKRY